MSKLHTIQDEVMSLDLGREVHRQYTSFAKQVMIYEKILYKQWISNIDTTAMGYLKMNILCTQSETGQVVTNFSRGLVKLMRETRYLDRMGLDIPEIALNVTLQEESYSKYVVLAACLRLLLFTWTGTVLCRRVEDLQLMLELYYEAMRTVPHSEAQLLQPIVKELEASLDPGFHVLNWNSLGIADFTQQCRKAINEFNTRVGQVLKNKRDIEALVSSIASSQLLPDVDDCSTVPTLQVTFHTSLICTMTYSLRKLNRFSMQEFYDSVEKHRLALVENLVKKYRTIPQLLGKIEEVVAGTNSGKSQQMVLYYQYWERCVFNALNEMVLHSMAKLFSLMQERTSKSKNPGCCKQPGLHEKLPLFKVCDAVSH